MAAYTVSKEDFDSRLKIGLGMFPQLSNYLKSKVHDLSGGERQMVAMSMALIRNPKVIMLDEPTANLSPKLATEVLRKIVDLARSFHMTVLLVEQNAKKALRELEIKRTCSSVERRYSKVLPRSCWNIKNFHKMYLGLKTNAPV